MIRIVPFLIFFSTLFSTYGQADTARARVDWENTELSDSARLNAIHELIWYGYVYSNPDTAFIMAETMLQFAKEANNEKGMANAYSIQGICYSIRGDNRKAIVYMEKTYEINKKRKDLKGAAASLGNIGVAYYSLGEYKKALGYYDRALKINQDIDDARGIGANLGNISLIHSVLGNYDIALQKSLEGLEYDIKSGVPRRLIAGYANVGVSYSKLDSADKALEYQRKCIEVSRKYNDQRSLATATMNVGVILEKQGDTEQALENYLEALEIRKTLKDPHGLAESYSNLAQLFAKRKEMGKAIQYGEQGYQLAKDNDLLSDIKANAKQLYQIYRKAGKHKKALEMHEAFIEARDTLLSVENRKSALLSEFEHQFRLKTVADSTKAAEAEKVIVAELAAERSENVRQQQRSYFLYGGLALTLLFGLFIFNRFRITNRQKLVIEEQKMMVEEKNREILDSIQYAKRLQDAILPPTKLVKEYLEQSFILYKPKDVVAGDFYWMETVGDTIYFAAADCTGHGVPGAMVSVVCSNALSKALVEENIVEPAKILDRTRELVINRFGRSEESIKDGMDISLCALNLSTNAAQWAGANNPLWIIRAENGTLEEIKGDKQPIGSYAVERPFTNHAIKFEAGDTLYLFSDGYPDQFGGTKGKKYKTGQLKAFLASIREHDMTKQGELLDIEFTRWKGNIDQIDDVCMIGVRI